MSVFDQFEKKLPGDRQKRQVDLDKAIYGEYLPQEEILAALPRSFWGFYAIILAVFLILISQLINLQISRGSFHRYLAEGNRTRQREIPAPRGLIYDQKGKQLVTNDASFALELYPLDLPRQKEEKEAFYRQLAEITQISEAQIKGTVEEKGFSSDTITLKENIDRDSALLLETKIVNLPGVAITKKPIRHYLPIEGLAPILGYVGKVTDEELKNNSRLKMNQQIGKEGLEKVYDQFLQGKVGINEIEVDAQGRTQRLLANTAPEPGNNLTLTIDADLEEKVLNVLASEIRAAGVSAGAAAVLNVKTGEVLALVSFPTYDNNLFAKGGQFEEYQKLLTDEDKPLFNRAVSGAYPSGSIIKPLVAAAGLQEGVIAANTTITDPGEIKVGSWTYPDWKAHGLVDVRKALAESCNVFFYSVGGGWDKIKGLGVEKLKNYFEKFGLSKKTGIDLPGEVDGLVPGPAWKEKTKKEAWYLGDTYHMAIGQGDVLVTPLQMAAATAAIANDGELIKPYLVKKITDKDGKAVKEFSKEITRADFVSGQNLQIVREGMRQAVNSSSGSARALGDLPVAAAAKTGTAQFGNEGKTHAWMTAFAPYSDPQIAMTVLIEGGGEGYVTAGPVVKNVFNWYFSR